MAIKSEALIYKIIEEHLKRAGNRPLSCVDLWEHTDVRMNAKSSEKVSDYLGLMWRRGLLQRWTSPATETSRARFSYTWKEGDPSPVQIDPPVLSGVKSNYKQANVTITEDGPRLVLDFEHFTMIIQSKG